MPTEPPDIQARQMHGAAGPLAALSKAVQGARDAGAGVFLVSSAVILLGVFAVAIVADGASRRYSDELRVSRSVESAVHEMAMLLRTLQSARRGYAVTRDRVLLAPFEAAVQLVPAKEQALRGLVADAPERRRAFEAFSSLLPAYLELITGLVATDAAVGFDRKRVVESFDQGERALQGLLDRLKDMEAVEQKLLVATLRGLDQTRARARLWNTLGILGAVLLLAAGWVMLASAKRTLARTARTYQRLVESLPVIVVGFDAHWRITIWNKTAEEQFGYAAEEVLGKPNPVVPPDRLPIIQANRARALRGEVVACFAARSVRKDGRDIDIVVAMAPMISPAGSTIGVITVAVDVSEQRREEAARLQQEREHRETLVREVHHRIKNHLQGIAGLLQQQARSVPQLEALVRPALAQVLSIAKVYGLSGRMTGLERSLADTVRAIAATVREITGAEVLVVEEPEEPRFAISNDEAVPIALIVGELLQNAIKHGDGGSIAVRLSAPPGEGSARLEMVNPGRLPDGFDLRSRRGLGDGLQLALAMMPRDGAVLELRQQGSVVATRLVLSPPVVSPLAGEPASRTAAAA